MVTGGVLCFQVKKSVGLLSEELVERLVKDQEAVS